MLDYIEFLFSEAWVALRRNTWMTFAAVTTAAVALFLLGGLAYSYYSISRFASTLPGKFTMDAFLQLDATKQQVSEAAAAIRALPGVSKVVWISREQFWEQERRKLPSLVTEGMENPMPHKFLIWMSDLSRAEQIAAEVRRVPSVDPTGVLYMAQEQELLGQLMRLLRLVGLGAGGLMLLTSGVLIYNAIRLTIVARRREIRIMRLVGAARATVNIPLVIEGSVQGLLGGVLAALLLWSSQAALTRLLQTVSALSSPSPFPVGAAVAGLALTGAVYGAVCSTLAVREPRRLF